MSTSRSERPGRSAETACHSLRAGWLGVFLALWAVAGLAQVPRAPEVDATAQEKLTQLLQKVIQDFWVGGDAKAYGPTNDFAGCTNAELAFRAAVELMPGRLDLRFGLASVLLGEALQTNGPPLEARMQLALGAYREIQALDPRGFDAPILYAAYARASGDTNASDNTIRELMMIHPARTSEYVARFNRVDRLLQFDPPDEACRSMPWDEHHAIVILGAGLETNGTMKPKLVSRLKQGLKLARRYRHAAVIVTGGNPRSGVTEAYMMASWLRNRGVSSKRLILEDESRDTVENAVYCSAILKRRAVTHVTLVTSLSHVRRALADLLEAGYQRGLQCEYDAVGVGTKGDAEIKPDQERLSIYRDVMRASGLWAFPGLRR